ncbi:MAG: hypothetical protein DRJ31_07855 [Candidatus Methanomethylicota archaeon]|uniref:Uncharacterized protein n=1 Tax=Thermoproteota archaeon TaxID=2056631 RepID=A0A497ENX4_9CREN|nr:MAG: hypothetical protein DRJ31_07855 [Candidatus Verstraetearchaeota archaeon]
MKYYYYLLWNPRLRKMIEYEVLEDNVVIDLGEYSIMYMSKTDRLVIRLKGLPVSVYDVSALDVEAVPATYLFDAVELLLKDSIVLYEEVNE